MSGSSFVFGSAGRLVALAFTVGVVAASAPTLGWAQGTSVEELERRLEKAKEERARRDAAAARARDGAEAERKRREADASRAESERKAQEARAESERKAQEARAESERKAQEARMSTLVVQADAPCALSANGVPLGTIAAGISSHRVSSGQKLVACVSTQERVSIEREVEARAGQDTLVRIELEQRVSSIRGEREQKQERARAEAEARARDEALTRARADAVRRAEARRASR